MNCNCGINSGQRHFKLSKELTSAIQRAGLLHLNLEMAERQRVSGPSISKCIRQTLKPDKDRSQLPAVSKGPFGKFAAGPGTYGTYQPSFSTHAIKTGLNVILHSSVMRIRRPVCRQRHHYSDLATMSSSRLNTRSHRSWNGWK